MKTIFGTIRSRLFSSKSQVVLAVYFLLGSEVLDWVGMARQMSQWQLWFCCEQVLNLTVVNLYIVDCSDDADGGSSADSNDSDGGSSSRFLHIVTAKSLCRAPLFRHFSKSVAFK